MAKKILIIENNKLMTEVMSYILVNNGYDVIALTNGEEIFNNIKSIHPDLIIMDSLLPGMGGQELCELVKLNKTTHNLPVIICSGDESGDEALNRRGAPDAVLHKPFDMSNLIDNVALQLAA